ncbi:hypothetical protein [Streptomyces liliifuscus]|uniref:Uncharacterized protein n=1 Tax=Streptomyces liliifuscus TaxID=2797636 RepID=A0A7T7I3V1_9ACTN|nr:hypothetical protein [Streptomyces liliifuscus]QQM40529.1 hypothetical protein JEQ17_14285 [Streptomyces liliifuscus]
MRLHSTSAEAGTVVLAEAEAEAEAVVLAKSEALVSSVGRSRRTSRSRSLRR